MEARMGQVLIAQATEPLVAAQKAYSLKTLQFETITSLLSPQGLSISASGGLTSLDKGILSILVPRKSHGMETQ